MRRFINVYLQGFKYKTLKVVFPFKNKLESYFKEFLKMLYVVSEYFIVNAFKYMF